MKSMNQLSLRFLVVAWATLTLIAGSSTETYSQSDSDVRLRERSYPISELYTHEENSSSPYRALEEYLFQKSISESDEDFIRLYGSWRRQMAKNLGLMKAAFEESGSVVRQSNTDAVRAQHREYLQKSEQAFYSHESFESFVSQFVANGNIDAAEQERLIEQVERLRMDAQEEAAKIWELRELTLEESMELEREMDHEAYRKALKENKVSSEDPELGRGEVNWIDGKKFIRGLPASRKEAVLFFAAEHFRPRSQHYAKYVASQHQDSGRSRNDGQRGRDVVTCVIQSGNQGDFIGEVRVHERHAPWSFDLAELFKGNFRDHDFVRFRQDELLFMRTHEGMGNRIKGMNWGFAMGILQGSLTLGVNKLFRSLGWVDADAQRWDVAVFAVAFSMFWGIFQPELRKFTARASMHWFEQNLRRIVSTGLAFNVTVSLMIHNLYHYSMFEVAGMLSFAQLLAVLTASNVLFKQVMDWRMHVDSRQGTNKHRLKISFPRFWRKASEKPEENRMEFDLGIKKSDYQQRVNSLTTFTYRFVEMENSSIIIGGVTIPIGSVIYWTLPIVELWRSLRHAERRESDLAPQIRKTWDRYVGWWLSPVTFPARVTMAGFAGAGRWAWNQIAGKDETFVQVTPSKSSKEVCKESLRKSKLLGRRP